MIAGQTNIGGACKTDDDAQQLEKVGIIQDDGGFDGIHTATHELGHLCV